MLWLGNGNELLIIRGNHDVEFLWHEVHEAFKDRLVKIYFSDEDIADKTSLDFKDRINFHPWFYYDDMGVFIEHGHQYDTYSSLEHLLYPLLPWNHSKVEWPAVSLAIRHGVNRLAGFTTHEQDDWTSLDYLRFFLTRNPANIPRLIRIYGQLLRRFLSYYINHRRTTLDPIGEIHGQVRRTLAPESGLSQTQLIELEKLHAPPRHLTLIGLINTSFIDRWLLFLFDSLFVVTLLTLDLPWWGWLLAMASMLG